MTISKKAALKFTVFIERIFLLQRVRIAHSADCCNSQGRSVVSVETASFCTTRLYFRVFIRFILQYF